jgi:heat shock protein HtpX
VSFHYPFLEALKMVMLRRIGFFIALNLVVVLTISFVMSILGVGRYMGPGGLNFGALMAFCLIWGMGGSFISLMLSKVMVKWTMGVQVIDPNTAGGAARELVETVHRLAKTAGLSTMPEVGIYESPEVNAFATGPTRNNSLVAVSTGLLNVMDEPSIEGVLGHEVTHIANGDMVTMMLLQGVVNAFVMALARIIAFAIDNFLRSDRDDRGGGLGYWGYALVVMALEMLLFIPGSMILGWFSRQREFRADRGGADVAGRAKMVSALRSLQRMHELNEGPQSQGSQAVASLKIAGGRKGWLALFATHPPLEERIARLEQNN